MTLYERSRPGRSHPARCDPAGWALLRRKSAPRLRSFALLNSAVVFRRRALIRLARLDRTPFPIWKEADTRSARSGSTGLLGWLVLPHGLVRCSRRGRDGLRRVGSPQA